jgi:hypothetical protein
MPKLQENERILKASRQSCQVMYKGKHGRITSDLSTETPKSKKA